MPVSLGGSNLEDPKALRDDMLRGGLPVGPWAELCNSFASPCEREPGVAHVLIRKADWTSVSDQTSLTLTFTDHGGTSVSFVKLVPVSAPTPLPQEYAPADPVLWLTLHDRRARYRQVAVNRGYNVRAANGGWETATLNSGTAWSWAGVVSDLWDKLKAVYTDLSASPPSLPSTPSGTPESFYFYSLNAWDALCTVCQAGGLLVRYDPTTDTTTIIDPAASAPAEPVLAVRTRTWDTAGNTDIPAAVPAAVTLSYHRIGLSDRHQISAAVTESGTTTGAAVVLPGYPAAAGDPVTNTTYLTAFAGRVRDFWRRDLMARAEPREVQYRGYQAWCLTAVGLGGWSGWSVSQLAGDEVQTALVSGPLLRLDPGEPYPTSSASATRPKYPLTPPCASFGPNGGFTGSYQVWFDPETGEAECIFTPPCPDCTSEGSETPGVGGAPPAGDGILTVTGGAWNTPAPLSGDVETVGGGTAATIPPNTVTYPKMQDITVTKRVIGRNTAGSGDPEEVSLTQLLDWVGSAANGDILVRMAGVWTRLAIGTTSYPLTVVAGLPAWAQLNSAGIGANQVPNSKLATMAAATIKGRAVGAGTGDATDLTATQATAILDAFTSSLKGLVPASGGGTTNFLRADGTFAYPAQDNAQDTASLYDIAAAGTASGVYSTVTGWTFTVPSNGTYVILAVCQGITAATGVGNYVSVQLHKDGVSQGNMIDAYAAQGSVTVSTSMVGLFYLTLTTSNTMTFKAAQTWTGTQLAAQVVPQRVVAWRVA